MSEISYHVYPSGGDALRTMFGWINGAPGLSAVDGARVGLGNLGNAFTESDQHLSRLATGLGAEWEGQAAAAVGTSLQETARFGGAGGAGTAVGSGSVDGYGQSFESLRPAVTWLDPGTWDWWEVPVDAIDIAANATPLGEVLSVQSDYFATMEENRTLEAQARNALVAHESAARDAVTAFPGPGVGTAVGPAGIGPGGVGGVSGWGGAGGLGPTAWDGGYPGAATTAGGGAAPVGGDGSRPGGVSTGGAGPVLAAGPLSGRSTPATPATAIGTAAPWSTPAAPGPPSAPGPGAGGPGAGGPGVGGPGVGGPGVGGSSAGGLGAYGSPGTALRPPTRAPSAGPAGSGYPGRDSAGLGSSGPRTSYRGGAGGVSGWGAPGGGGGTPSWGGGSPGGGARGALGAGPGGNGTGGAPPPSGGTGGRGYPGSAGYVPMTGGAGAGGSGPTEHRRKYWIPTDEAFDVPLPPHGPAVIGGEYDE